MVVGGGGWIFFQFHSYWQGQQCSSVPLSSNVADISVQYPFKVTITARSYKVRASGPSLADRQCRPQRRNPLCDGDGRRGSRAEHALTACHRRSPATPSSAHDFYFIFKALFLTNICCSMNTNTTTTHTQTPYRGERLGPVVLTCMRILQNEVDRPALAQFSTVWL